MTTNETYFFRDPAHYDAIRTVLLPRLKEERRDTKKLRFWSAAASTGQEAYSLAMLLLENGLSDWNIQILGTDFSSQVVERARSGKYQQIEVNRGLPAALLVKHFRRSGVDWQLSEPVRRMARFETIDLRKSMRALGPFDLVFCRNVMIYFDAETKKNILKELHGTLFRGGWLLLGGAETAFGVEEWFDKTDRGKRDRLRRPLRGTMPTELSSEIVPSELAQIVESVFETMMGLEVSECGTPWFPSGDRLTAAVHLTGDWNGAVLVECDRGQACRFAGRFLSVDPPERVDDVVRDVLGELANMIGGNMKCALTQGIRLSMPSVVDGGDYSLRICGAGIRKRLSFRSVDGNFWVTFLATRL